MYMAPTVILYKLRVYISLIKYARADNDIFNLPKCYENLETDNIY